MTFKDCQFTPKHRRGLSSVVGALLFVVLMVATFAVLGVALNSQTDIVSTGRDVAELGLEKQQEKFSVTNIIQPPGNFLQVNLKNNGQNAAEIFTLIITNSSDVAEGFPTKTYEIPSNTSFLSPGDEDSTNIIETLNLKMANAAAGETDQYSFKVISSLGTIEKLNVECDENAICGLSIGGGGTGNLAVQLFLDGPNGVNTKTSTVIMFVSNIGDVPLEDVWPDTLCPDLGNQFPEITPPGGLEDFTGCTISPPKDSLCGSVNNDGDGICLAVGQTALFKWDGVVSGDIGDEFLFCNSVSGEEEDDTLVGPSNVDCDILTVIDPNDCGGCGPGGEGGETIILLDDLLIRPSIFMTLPSPFGSTGSQASFNDNVAVWGVEVANPTNSTFSISKVTITAFAPGANNNLLVFDNSGLAENISPSQGDPTIGSWNFADENVLVWRNFTNPVVLPPYSSESFLLKVKAESNGGKNIESIIVQSSVFSTIGSFGKAGYQTTSYSISGSNWSPLANVFLALNENSVANADITSSILNMTNGTSVEMIASFADMDNEDNTYIASGAKFTINVPREWGFDGIDYAKSSSKFILSDPTEPEIIFHSDGSTQIIATLQENLGDETNPEVGSIVFNVTPPNEKDERMYIMYILGDGLTEDSKSVGPSSEVVLHVIGNVTGYP